MAASRSVVGGRVKERRGPSGKWFQIAPENRVLGTCHVFEGPRFLVPLLNHQPRGRVDAHELHPTRVRFGERADHEIAISLEFSWRIVRGERDVGRQSRTMIRVAPAFPSHRAPDESRPPIEASLDRHSWCSSARGQRSICPRAGVIAAGGSGLAALRTHWRLTRPTEGMMRQRSLQRFRRASRITTRSRLPRGCGRRGTRKRLPSTPSITRWSYDSARYIIVRIAIASSPSTSTTTGRFLISPIRKIPTCG